MQLGWIDFSKTERDKVLNVMTMFSERGTVDELGIAPVRDGFANLFFPGTSTIQTRAKYFLIVPYMCKSLESSSISDSREFMRAWRDLEISAGANILINNSDTAGVAGKNSLSEKVLQEARTASVDKYKISGMRSLNSKIGNTQIKWVKRWASSIYWAGLKKYEIFKADNLSMGNYAAAICSMKNNQKSRALWGSRNDTYEENMSDDLDAGKDGRLSFWSIPTYAKDWLEHISMDLTYEEAEFLKKQIIKNCKGSMLAQVLENNITEFIEIESFDELESIIDMFSDETKEDWKLACDFSRFNYFLRVIYNDIVWQGNNEMALQEIEYYMPILEDIAAIDIDEILSSIQNIYPIHLKRFLKDAQNLMMKKDLDGLRELITKREVLLKGSNRAKTKNPDKVELSWFCGGMLNYRFSKAKVIVKDIMEGERRKNA